MPAIRTPAPDASDNPRASFLQSLRQDPRLLGLIPQHAGSGLAVGLLSLSVSVWLSEAGVPLRSIGLVGLAALPFALKFIWSPHLEGALAPLARLLGHRKSWILPLNLISAASVAALAFIDPKSELPLVVACLFVFALACASEAVVSEAMRIDRTRANGRLAVGVALGSLGGRIGAVVGGALPLVLAHAFGWPTAFLGSAAFLLLVSVGAVLLGESSAAAGSPEGRKDVKALKVTYGAPFREFFSRKGAWLLLAFIMFHRFGDQMAAAMTGPFLSQAGYDKAQIALATTGAATVGGLLGIAVGYLLYARISERICLLLGVLMLALSNLGFVALARVAEVNTNLLLVVFLIEALASGMAGLIVAALISRICDPRYVATQYALLSGITFATRILTGAPTGFLAERLGYEQFFLVTIAAFTPGLVLLGVLAGRGMLSGKPSPPLKPAVANLA